MLWGHQSHPVIVLAVSQSDAAGNGSNLHNMVVIHCNQQLTRITYEQLKDVEALFPQKWYLMIIMMVILHKDNSQSDDWSHHIQTRP